MHVAINLSACCYFKKATYVISHYFCLMHYVGTSPVRWNNLSSGKHSVIVRAKCLIDGVAYSSTSIRFEFRVR